MTQCDLEREREGGARPGRVFEASVRNLHLVLRERGRNGRVQQGKDRGRFTFGSETQRGQEWRV